MSDEMNDQVDARGEAYERFWQDFGAKGHKVSMKMLEQLYDAGYEAALQPLDDETGLCECGHHWSDHRDENYDADVAGSMPGQGRCGECDCSKFTNRRQGSLDGGWVAVSERLPSEDGAYLVKCDNGKVRVCDLYAFENHPDFERIFHFPYCEHNHNSITHWMPIPPFAPADKGGEK